MKRILIIIILIIICSSITFYIGRQIGLNTDTSNTVTTITEETVSTRTITNTQTFSGEIQSQTTENLTLDTSKYFEMMCVEESDTVSEGENILKYTNGTYLTAPYNCVVISYSVPYSESKCTSSNYVQIESLDDLQLSISISESEIQDISEGSNAEITLSADETKTYTGTLSKIDSIGQYSTGGTTFSAIVTFENDGSAKIGMSATVSVTVEEATDVIAVPINAVTVKDDKKYVTVIDNNTESEIEIETGISDDEYVEVTSGLNGGETIKITTTTTQNTVRSTSENEETSTPGGRGDFSRGDMEMTRGGGQGGQMGGEMPSGTMPSMQSGTP